MAHRELTMKVDLEMIGGRKPVINLGKDKNKTNKRRKS